MVDPHTGTVYLTEDTGDSRFFRWVPDVTPAFGTRPDFDHGTLQVASFDSVLSGAAEGPATWIDVDAFDPTTYKPLGSTSFVRGEGIWYHDRIVYWVASTFCQIYAYDTVTDTRFYFASQRMASPNDPTNATAGVIYEITGPFNRSALGGVDSPADTDPAGPGDGAGTPATTTPPAAAPTEGSESLPATGGGGLPLAGLGIGAAGLWLRRRQHEHIAER